MNTNTAPLQHANACPCPFCGRKYSTRRHDPAACWSRTWLRLLVEAGLVERAR